MNPPLAVATTVALTATDRVQGALAARQGDPAIPPNRRDRAFDGIQPNALRELNDVLAKLLSGGEHLKKKALGECKPDLVELLPRLEARWAQIKGEKDA